MLESRGPIESLILDAVVKLRLELPNRDTKPDDYWSSLLFRLGEIEPPIGNNTHYICVHCPLSFNDVVSSPLQL